MWDNGVVDLGGGDVGQGGMDSGTGSGGAQFDPHVKMSNIAVSLSEEELDGFVADMIMVRVEDRVDHGCMAIPAAISPKSRRPYFHLPQVSDAEDTTDSIDWSLHIFLDLHGSSVPASRLGGYHMDSGSSVHCSP